MFTRRLPALILLIAALIGQWTAAAHASEHLVPEVREAACLSCTAQPAPSPVLGQTLPAWQPISTLPLGLAPRPGAVRPATPGAIRGPPLLKA